MQGHGLVARSHEVLNDVRSRGVSATVAEPFTRLDTLHHAGLIRKPTVGASILRKLHFHESVFVMNAAIVLLL
jgi:hypothetical protein